MDADPFDALGSSIRSFLDAADSSGRLGAFEPGSPAFFTCEEEPLADEWGARPTFDSWLRVRHRWLAATDHMRALAELLTADRVIFPMFTVARGALEACAVAYHAGMPGIDRRERVRRSMNDRLDSLHEQDLLVAAMERDGSPAPGSQLAADKRELADRQKRIVESAQRQGFRVSNRRDKYRPTFLGEKPPSSTVLCSRVVSEQGPLGEVYFRILSAAAHSKDHGLTSMVQSVDGVAEQGAFLGRVSISSREAALRLIAAPLAAATIVGEVFPQFGWDVPVEATQHMLYKWGRIAEVPHPDDPGRS